jgi:hypothetical protein
MRIGIAVLTAALLLCAPPRAFAEWQFKPFLGITFGGGTNIVVAGEAVGHPKLAVGANAGWLGEVLGWEGDVTYVPGFFEHGDKPLVLKSRLATVTGNVIVAVPRRLTQYTLRPYVVAGGGFMSASTSNTLGVLEVSNTFGVVDFGGGATGFVSQSFGWNWDLRYFRTVNAMVPPGLSATGVSGTVSFWRATMAVAVRY